MFDKLGSARKWLLFGCICVGALLNNALLFVDARQPNITQQASTFSFRCAGELENQGWSFSFPTQKTFHNLTDYINGGIIIKCRTPPDSPPSSKLSVETHSSHHVSIIQDGDSKLDDDGWLCKANVWNITCLADTLADVLAAEVKEYGQAGRQQGFWIYVALMLGSRIWYFKYPDDILYGKPNPIKIISKQRFCNVFAFGFDVHSPGGKP